MIRNLLAGIACLFSFGFPGLPVEAAQLGPADPYVLAQCPSLAELLGQGTQRLVNPVLNTPADVARRRASHREMLACLNSVRVSAPFLDWARTVRYHLRLYQAFSDPLEPNSQTSTLDLINLTVSRDIAVRRLIEDVGIRAPDGLVFIRYFQSPSQMPDIIGRAFESPQTRAVTISSRYVAVLSPTLVRQSQGSIDPALATTLSHELVHAFLNARLDFDAAPEGFPRWFHEGMAIHFGDRGRVHVSVDPASGNLLRTEPAASYEKYERVFLYLESELGTEQFHRAVRRAVEDVEPSILYQSLGFGSYDELLTSAEIWWRWWPLPPGWLQGRSAWTFAIVIVVLSASALTAWRRWQPAVAGSALELGVNRDLIASVKSGDVANVRYLLRSGASTEAMDESGWSALAWAVWRDNAAVVELLIDQGAEATPVIRKIADVRLCSPETVRMLSDAVTRTDDNSVAMD